MRGAWLIAGVVLVTIAVPLSHLGMTGHMAAHMIAVAVAAPLLALALRGTAADPVRLVPALASPLALSVVDLAVVWLWHLPAARRAADASGLVSAVELACFLLAGTWLWSAVIALRPAARASGVGALLLTSMHMTLLGALVGLAPRSLYPAMAHGVAGGLSALEDQQLAGVVMLAVGGVSYLLGALAVLATLLQTEAGRA